MIVRLLFVLLILLLAAGASVAAEEQALLAHGNGRIHIGPDGRVVDVQLDGRFGDEITGALERQIRTHWAFEPVIEHGQPISVEGRMDYRLRAVERESGGMQLFIERVSFSEADADGEARDTRLRNAMKPPQYPKSMLREHVGAIVMLLIEVAPDGNVVRAAPLDGWVLSNSGSRLKVHAMRAFSKSAIAAVESWKLYPSTNGKSWFATVPVTFLVGGSGLWQRGVKVEVPPEPWMIEGKASALALGEGGAGSRLRLTTPLEDVPAG